MTDFRIWKTPDGLLEARAVNWYEGLKGQMRVVLVDRQGRVHHFDWTTVQ